MGELDLESSSSLILGKAGGSLGVQPLFHIPPTPQPGRTTLLPATHSEGEGEAGGARDGEPFLSPNLGSVPPAGHGGNGGSQERPMQGS